MSEFLNRLKELLNKIQSIYTRSKVLAQSVPLNRWHSTIVELAVEEKPKDITPNATNGHAEEKKANGTKKSKSQNGSTFKSVFDQENYVCLKCRYRTNHSSALSYHINKKHSEEDKEALLQKRCAQCKLTFYKSFQYQKHYIAWHDTRTDEEVQDEFEQEEVKRLGIKTKGVPKVNLPKGTNCEQCQKELKTRYQHYIHIQTIHIEDYKLWTLCEHVQKNPYLAKEHLKRNHRTEYDANEENPEALLTELPNDLFGKEETKPIKPEAENSTILID